MLTAELTYERRMTGMSITERITRSPCKCNAEAFWWRETVLADSDDQSTDGVTEGATDGLVPFFPTAREKHFCIYDRSTQTFRTREITGFDSVPVSVEEARIQAFLRQPILTPLLPIPMGFQWHVPSESGYMNFQLESETTVGGMSVLFIRRHGRFPLDGFGIIEREGVTAYALERSTVLEDRTRDRIADSGTEVQTVTKLVKSMVRRDQSEED
jgi:hypothetical protein